MPESRRLAGAFLVLAIAITSFSFFWFATLDDAYISIRYAVNWANGDGLVFNPGERVEGFSNFLWIIFLAIGSSLGLPELLIAKLLGSVFAVATLGLLVVFPGEQDKRVGLAAALLVATSGGFAYHAVAGLETILFGFLVTALALAWNLTTSPRRAGVVALLACLAAMTRPEGAGILLLVVAAGGLLGTGRARLLAFTPLAFAGALLMLRFSYFGGLLPNTYYAKPTTPSVAGLVAGLSYLHRSLLEDGRYGELGLALALFVVSARFAVPALRRRGLPLAILWIFGAAFAVWTGGDWIARSRFLVPYQPVLALLAASALASFGATPLRRRVAVAAFGLLIGFRVISGYAFARDLRDGGIYDHAHVSSQNAALGEWLGNASREGDAILADEIGAIGYYSGLRVLDFWGLVDGDVARRFHDAKFNPYAGDASPALRSALQGEVAELLLERNPRFVVIDYRGPIDEAVNPNAVNSATMRELYRATVGRGYRMIHRMAVDPMSSKSFLIYRLPRLRPGRTEAGLL